MNEATTAEVRAAFEAHQAAERLYVTCDGQIFLKSHHADSHCQTLPRGQRSVEVVERDGVEGKRDSLRELADDAVPGSGISTANTPQSESGGDEGNGSGAADAGASASGADDATQTGNGDAASTTNETGGGGGKGGSDATGPAPATRGFNLNTQPGKSGNARKQ